MYAAQMINSDFHPSALAEIYQKEVSIAVWQRQLDTHITDYAQWLTSLTPCFQTRFAQSPASVAKQLEKELPLHKNRQLFIQDITLVVDMFACLFELETVGLRMAVLKTAMCPKFHVDRVPCRLISTYCGAATQWHSHEQIQRFENGTLAPHANAKPYNLRAGDVALLKGEAWEGNEGRGLVHRSPSASDDNRRLVLTLDFA